MHNETIACTLTHVVQAPPCYQIVFGAVCQSGTGLGYENDGHMHRLGALGARARTSRTMHNQIPLTVTLNHNSSDRARVHG